MNVPQVVLYGVLEHFVLGIVVVGGSKRKGDFFLFSPETCQPDRQADK